MSFIWNAGVSQRSSLNVGKIGKHQLYHFYQHASPVLPFSPALHHFYQFMRGSIINIVSKTYLILSHMNNTYWIYQYILMFTNIANLNWCLPILPTSGNSIWRWCTLQSSTIKTSVLPGAPGAGDDCKLWDMSFAVVVYHAVLVQVTVNRCSQGRANVISDFPSIRQICRIPSIRHVKSFWQMTDWKLTESVTVLNLRRNLRTNSMDACPEQFLLLIWFFVEHHNRAQSSSLQVFDQDTT